MSAAPPDPQDPATKRAHERFDVVGVRGGFRITTDATVLNLSIDGMAIETATPLTVGRRYTLELSQADATLPLDGRVIWCSLVRTEKNPAGEVSPIYRAGIHFEGVLSGRPADLVEFLREHAVVSLEQRLFGRFKIERDRGAHVGCETAFRVRELSLTGMLVETDLAPQTDVSFETEIRLPDLSFETLARIVRAEPIEALEAGASTPHFLVGVEFLEMSPEARSALERFLDQQVV